MPAARLVGFAGAVAILVFMVARTAADLDLGAVVWWPLPLAFLGASVWWLLGARGWSILLTGRASREDMSMWCRTQALRYLPGGIWAPVSRAIAISGGLLDRISTVAMDNVIALCAALTIGSLALAVDGDLRWLSLAIVIGGPYVAARVLGPRIRAGTTRTLHATWNYLGAFAAYALAAVLVQAAVSGLDDPLAVAGAATIAWGAGFAVVIAPSGAGVRELVYVALLSGAFPTAEATAAALTLRVLTTAAELAVLFLVARPDVSVRRQGKETTANE
jgi:hypothetical protein